MSKDGDKASLASAHHSESCGCAQCGGGYSRGGSAKIAKDREKRDKKADKDSVKTATRPNGS